MNTKALESLESQLRAFIAGRSHDPAADLLATRATALETQLQTAKDRQARAQQADVDETLRAEQALVDGAKVDGGARQRLRAAALEAEDTTRLLSAALERARRDAAKARATRADRDLAMLTPVFVELIGLASAKGEDLLQIMDVLMLAHDTATGVLPGALSPLQGGFAGLLTPERLDQWRQRAEAAGLLKVDQQRVA